MSVDINLIEELYLELINVINPEAAATLETEQLFAELMQFVEQYSFINQLTLTHEDKEQIATALQYDLKGLGPIEPLLADPAITEIMVNSQHQIYVEKKGKIEKAEIHFRSDRHVLNIAQRIAHEVNRRIDESSPMVDARLADGSRVNIIIPPIALSGPTITIRKFSKIPLEIKDLVEAESLSPAMARFMEICAKCKVNIIVSGGTGSGKTTLLNVLSQMIPSHERVITIEDAAELKLSIPNLVRLESRLPNAEGKGEITIHDLLKNCLRMRPDRIVVGEVRGIEAFEMLKALNTGHDGSMSTVHANSAEEALLRLENIVATYNQGIPSSTVRAQIVSAIDVIFHIQRLPDGSRRVVEVLDIQSVGSGNIIARPLFSFNHQGEDSERKIIGEYISNKLTPSFYHKIRTYNLQDQLKECLEII